MKRIYLIAFICLILASCDTTNVPSVSTTEQKVSINLSWKGSLSSAPQNPKAGDMYYNTTQKKSFIYDGSSWQIIAQDGKDGSNGSNGSDGQNTVTDIDGYLILWQGSLNSAPSNPAAGWAYYDTIKKKSFIYDGTDWQVLAQDGNDGQDGQGGTSNTNNNTSLKDTVYIGESIETIEGITYTVQSYAEVNIANPYFYTYYKSYYLNDKLRRIYCFYHNVGSALDYPYTEFQEHYCNNNGAATYIYNENGILKLGINYTNGEKTQYTEYYESGYKKIWNAYTNGIITLSITYYDLPNSPTFIQINYNSVGKPSREIHLYPNGTTKLNVTWNNETISNIVYYYQSGYIKYYYTNGYFYTFDDNKTGKGNISLSEDVYSSKTAFTEEEALAKLEELRNE